MLIFVRTEMGDNIVITKYEIQDRQGVPLDQQRLICASRQLEDGRRILDYNIEGESTMFVMLRRPCGMQTFVEGSVTDGMEAERSSTVEDSECSDDNQHNV